MKSDSMPIYRAVIRFITGDNLIWFIYDYNIYIRYLYKMCMSQLQVCMIRLFD